MLYLGLMGALTDTIDLSRLNLEPGGGYCAELDIRLEPFVFSGEKYPVEGNAVAARLDISRTMGGYVFRLRGQARLDGPCMRCFDRIEWRAQIDSREVHEPSQELACDYVGGTELDLAQWLRDAVGLALPASISGPLDVNDRCTACGRTIQELGVAIAEEAEPNEPKGPDPRWEKLRELDL